jgi:hypothetical protein
VHAFEYLRSVARARRADEVDTASGFVQMVAHGALDGPDLLVAARRMTERHPQAVPLWWAAARLVVAPDPTATAREILDGWHADLDGDPRFDDAPEPDSGAESRPATVTAVAASSRTVVLGRGEFTRFDAARLAGRRVRVEVPFGRSLDDALLGGLLDASTDHDWVVIEVDGDMAIRHLGPSAPHSAGLLRRSVI